MENDQEKNKSQNVVVQGDDEQRTLVEKGSKSQENVVEEREANSESEEQTTPERNTQIQSPDATSSTSSTLYYFGGSSPFKYTHGTRLVPVSSEDTNESTFISPRINTPTSSPQIAPSSTDTSATQPPTPNKESNKRRRIDVGTTRVELLFKDGKVVEKTKKDDDDDDNEDKDTTESPNS